jgi:crossover junction endodeoxyribonuclease RuvC
VHGSQHDRSGLWWLVLDPVHWDGRARDVVEVPPTCRAKYATGKGNAPKDAVLAAAIRRFPDWDITGNDVADAVILAAMGARHLGHPIDQMPAAHLTAMAAVRWPTTSGAAA